MVRIVVLLLFILHPVLIWAQEKEIVLPNVSVSAKKNGKQIKGQCLVDSIGFFSGGRNLNQGLSLAGPITLRNYGPSGISSLSIRGAGASGTVFLWKGLPVNNPMLGQGDASLIAGPMMENAKLDASGGNQLAASENFGGVVELGSPSQVETEGVRLGFSGGSFSNAHQWLIASKKVGNGTFAIRTWNQAGQNDFTFLQNGIRRKQTHSYRAFRGIESEYKLVLPRNLVFEAALWSQKSDREYGPSLHETSSEASQVDENHRVITKLRWQNNSTSFQISSGASQDRLAYSDPKSSVFLFFNGCGNFALLC